MKSKKYVVANWKMNPLRYKEAEELFSSIKKHSSKLKKTLPILCVPSLFLIPLALGYKGKKVFLAGQDVSLFENTGAHTGELSAQMVHEAGAHCVIIGHSERRALGESDEIVRKKFQIALTTGLGVILCVGETVRDTGGAYLGEIARQLTAALYGAPKTILNNLIIAYEPVWAIGGDKAMSSHDMHTMSLFIKKVLRDFFDEEGVASIPLLYGGAIDASNSADMLMKGEVDGLLVGRASLDAASYCILLDNAERS
jgi:triosephosphate isomerase (TIM)